MKAHALIVCVFLLVAVTKSAVPVSYNIDWATVPTAVATRNLESTELGKCICDLHKNSCDPNCCCDPDCTTESASFESCSREAFSNGKIESCFTLNSGTERFRGKEIEVLDRSRPGEDAVCVYRDNYPSDRVNFFEVPGSIPATDIVAPTVQDWNTPATSLKVGGTIALLNVGHNDAGWFFQESAPGYLTIPTSGAGGICNDDVAVKFMKPTTHTSCFREHSEDHGLCEQIRADKYIKSALGAKGTLITSQEDAVGFSVYIVDAVSGELITSTSAASIFDQLLTPDFATPSPPAPTNASDAGRRQAEVIEVEENPVVNNCTQGMVKSVIIIDYDFVGGGPVITAVNMTAYVTQSLPQNVSRFKQEHTVTFRKKGATALPHQRSGNPGYVAGSKVLAGTLISNAGKNAIQERVHGLAVPFGDKCSEKKFKSVKFQHDVINSGCQVELTEAEFKDICLNQKSEELLNTILYPDISDVVGQLNVNTTVATIDRIARAGDAHGMDAAGWVEVSSEWPTVTSRYTSIRRACDNMVIGVQYVIVIGRAGAEYNPQDVILGAKVEPIVGSWAYRKSTSTDMFPFKFKVKFVRHDASSEATKSRKVIPPPILPAMDDNIFYPFRFPGRQTDTGSN